MKKKNGKRIIAGLLAAGLFAASVLSPLQPEGAAAATKIKVSKTKVTVAGGGQVTVKVKNTGSRKVKAKVSGKKIIAVKVMKKKIRITGKKSGKTKLILKAAHMKKCVIRVTVRNMGQNDPTIIMPMGSSTPMVKVSASPVVSPAVRITLHPSATPVRSPQSSIKPSNTPVPTGTSAVPSETNEPQDSTKPIESSLPDQTTVPTMAPQPPVTSVPTTTPPPSVTTVPAETPTTKPTIKPTTVPTATPVATMKTTQLSFAKKSVYIGESITALKAEWGEPERIDPLPQKSLYGYIYNGNSQTEPYLIVGVKGEKVVSYFTIAKNFTAYDAVISADDNETIQQTKLIQQGASAQSMIDAGWTEPGSYEFDALDSSKSEARVGTEAYYKLTDNAYIYAFSDYFDGGDKSIYGMYAFSGECTKYSMMYRTYMTFTDEILRAAEQEVYEMTNAYRNYMGKALFKLEDRTTTAARKHSEDMANNNYFQHNSLDGSKFSARLTAEGISWSGAGENICAGAGDAINMVIGWIGSSGHRKGMLTDFKYIGVGAAYSSSADMVSTVRRIFGGRVISCIIKRDCVFIGHNLF
ncbi:CAP domain-containing protein [Roseburia sp. AM59-24XD]|uniref:CAP domain-containing protein n=1 Tax=Roseburia sp. AM59-24XD TaxID=2293138 RepID=UPI000E4E84DD|nr:CAP domain-containing protein [Roseburia sp. AM59-24XD]RHP82710.1 hypothetical protein DXA20_13135 [Roseburia sp. AM59-24XD]